MPTYPFYQVDAFTTQALGGNPCAIIFNADDLNETQRLAIAREMNLSETAFVQKSSMANFGVRYFTPAEEIPMAGHPTIATTFALIDSGQLPLTADHLTITLELKIGAFQVEIYSHQGKVERIVMQQRTPQFLQTLSPAEVMPVFGLTAKDVLPNAPIQIVSTGTPQLMIAVRDHAVLKRINMDHARYTALRAQANFFSPHLFCLGGITPHGHTFARHFGTPPDTMEDPFTGSATGGMAAYLYHHGFITQNTFIAEQGHWMNRPGQAIVEIIGSRQNISAVKVGGAAVTVLRGELIL